jgi:hypothetical protein
MLRGVNLALLQNPQQERAGSNPAQQNNRTETECSRLITYPVFLASVLSPFALIMNVDFPYWDFIFTLIYNLSLGRWVAEGLTATFVTTAMLALAVIFSELSHRRVFCGKQADSTPLHALEASGL